MPDTVGDADRVFESLPSLVKRTGSRGRLDDALAELRKSEKLLEDDGDHMAQAKAYLDEVDRLLAEPSPFEKAPSRPRLVLLKGGRDDA